ncbi:MAG: apolipoprotein N-acyltransferase [Paracoccaceae bacterium]|nr:apolipoprotein N-acyltransferase [Paracoccaceae bacterium]MDP5333114.1 apolipoprotein N-acyltransferase [Paracoccaceae bacterium]
MARVRYRFGGRLRVWPHFGTVFGVFALGAFAALGQAPIDAWYVTILAFSLIFFILTFAENSLAAGLLGLGAGLGYFAASLNWIVLPFFVDAPSDGWMAPFALFFMAGGLACFWALASWLGFLVMQRAGGGILSRRGFILALVIGLTGAEYLRGVVFTGFPWASIGHVWINTPLSQVAALAGPNGLTLLLLAMAALPVGFGWRGFGFSVLLLGVIAAFGLYRLSQDEPITENALTVRLVQPNAKQSAKWAPEFANIYLERQLAFSAARPLPDVIIWPETAVPYSLQDPIIVERMAQAAQGRPLLFGFHRYADARVWNSLGLITANGDFEPVYDKFHLVPFGEYIPFGDQLYDWFGLTGLAATDGQTYSAGPGPKVVDLEGFGSFLPLICYEAVFTQSIQNAATRPNWLLQVTNDAWFGNFSGPAQHLAQARLRAIEQGLPMVRVANTGFSAIIDPKGRITAQILLNQAAYKDGPLAQALAPTPYALWGGEIFFALIGFLIFILIFVRLSVRT